MQEWDFSNWLKNEFETAMVNELSVFEPLLFYRIVSWICNIARDGK